jgi:hypothetical protein
VLGKLERMGLTELRKHTVFEHFWTPLDIAEQNGADAATPGAPHPPIDLANREPTSIPAASTCYSGRRVSRPSRRCRNRGDRASLEPLNAGNRTLEALGASGKHETQPGDMPEIYDHQSYRVRRLDRRRLRLAVGMGASR